MRFEVESFEELLHIFEAFHQMIMSMPCHTYLRVYLLRTVRKKLGPLLTGIALSYIVKEPMMNQPKEITSQEKQAKRMASQKGFQLT